MRSWFTLHKNKPQEIIAIDIGTASVSAALAHINTSGFIEIISVLRYPFDLLGDFTRSDRQKKVIYMLKNSIAKAFSDMHHISSSTNSIRISFADPFFEEREIETIINRHDATKTITEKEINMALVDTKGWIVLNSLNKSDGYDVLVNIVRKVTQLRVNGYIVSDAVGYRGDTLEIRVHELSISSVLRDCIIEQQDTFYPHSFLQYYSDVYLLRRAIFEKKINHMPILVIDIGGEVTTLFVLKDFDIIQKCAPIFFGLRTLERRIAAFLKIDRTHAESIVRQYADGTLDEALKKKIESLLGAFLEDWYAGLRASLKNALVRPAIVQVMVVGSGKETSSFIKYLDLNIKEFSREELNIKTSAFSVETDLFLPQQSLSEGGDSILASLILYG